MDHDVNSQAFLAIVSALALVALLSILSALGETAGAALYASGVLI